MRGMPRRVLLLSIACYRRLVSPVIPPHCRFHPTCSRYAEEAVARHGVLYGGWLALRRLLRCHPWSGHSGFDPVPTDREGESGRVRSA
ncbi:MAG: membrane protein insertion efficiency factor YidD [Zetaproteobacteria bacterium]|nr:MAG: membrane protein insertion efficiency factor YidD [Zetaproteobacteria bacterium]